MAGPSLDMTKLGVEGSPEEESSESPEEAKSEGDDPQDMHLDDAWDAIQSGDQGAFKEAMKKCILASDEGGYTGPDGTGDEG